ncbi:predicted protein [Histoplasma capsulatum var. duboisii H88]|uniref:Predicted protein n=1 Tax=Ajellomyces capsulatus (strain H88) TaxID=544711 RepID=F0UUT1_AJEC8|nr:predicted protein [Histoplasma capsulatum var. duboisii H88]
MEDGGELGVIRGEMGGGEEWEWEWELEDEPRKKYQQQKKGYWRYWLVLAGIGWYWWYWWYWCDQQPIAGQALTDSAGAASFAGMRHILAYYLFIATWPVVGRGLYAVSRRRACAAPAFRRWRQGPAAEELGRDARRQPLGLLQWAKSR